MYLIVKVKKVCNSNKKHVFRDKWAQGTHNHFKVCAICEHKERVWF